MFENFKARIPGYSTGNLQEGTHLAMLTIPIVHAGSIIALRLYDFFASADSWSDYFSIQHVKETFGNPYKWYLSVNQYVNSWLFKSVNVLSILLPIGYILLDAQELLRPDVLIKMLNKCSVAFLSSIGLKSGSLLLGLFESLPERSALAKVEEPLSKSYNDDDPCQIADIILSPSEEPACIDRSTQVEEGQSEYVEPSNNCSNSGYASGTNGSLLEY